MIFGLPRLYIYAALAVAAAVALWGAIAWIQAAERTKLENEALRSRLEAIEDARRRRDEIENLPDSDLLQRLLDRVRGNGG